MSEKSIDKDHIRPSLSGPGTEHPHGDVNYLCFTTKTPGRAIQSLHCYKTFNAVSPGYIEVFVKKKIPPRQAAHPENGRMLLIAFFFFATYYVFYSPHGSHKSQGDI